MDGSDVKSFNPSGAGEVNCQVSEGPWEQFHLEPQDDGTYAIASINFPGVYLRMDGTGLSEDNPGEGVVNCQFGVGPWEKFKISKGKGPFTGLTIESAHFPNVFLKMDSSSCSTFNGLGCGKVSCVWGASFEPPLDESFEILPPPNIS
ncbi:hypothetical protein DN730_16065 [Marinomonas piezotolerans]|uniref:Uncharacterized protein n=2 Tax=Marinomonas piezotolerans TaxID=2213058 RepID=A0A370U5F6_9GAMM|nr:hypothetical protein DN730_16065 [Marinomonas piezotolerans]